MSFFGQISDTWQAVVHLIIRPPRHEYSVNRELGPKCTIIGGKLVIREDLELMNPRGLVLKCSHFMPAEPEDEDILWEGSDGIPKLRPRKEPFPCVVYCHGNAGSRVDAVSLLPVLLPEDVGVFCFDFSGAGQSEGKFLSLGYYEKDDLSTVVDYLKSHERVTRIGLWGHSMGACTCLLYAASGGDQVASAMVVDSSFVSLEVVIQETAAVGKQKLAESVAPAITLMPDMFIPMAVAAIRRSIQNQAEYDIREVNPLSKCDKLLLPALFGHAEQDEMIPAYHSLRLHEAYGGNSTMIRFEGRHNTPRSPFFLDSALHFLKCILRPSGAVHPAEALVYHNASHIRGLLAGSASTSNRRTVGKGYR